MKKDKSLNKQTNNMDNYDQEIERQNHPENFYPDSDEYYETPDKELQDKIDLYNGYIEIQIKKAIKKK